MDLASMEIMYIVVRDMKMLKGCLPISKMSVHYYKNL